MDSKPTALIVGAGIGGLAAAWWLDKAGWNSIIIERAASIRDGGFVVGITGLGLETAKRMEIESLLEGIKYVFDENVVKDNNGKELIRIRYEDVHGGIENMAVCRGDIVVALSKALPKSATIRFSETLATATDDGSKIQATLRSGETIEADLLIGADGIRSSIRDQFWKDENCLEDLGYSYGVYDFEGNNDFVSDCVSYNSPGHLDILYNMRNNRVAALHIWRDDETKVQDRELRYEILRDVTAGGVKLVSDVIARAEEAKSPVLIDSLTMVNLSCWSKGRVLLLGDAAHCLTLMSGQGASMALASAEMLGKELMETKDISQALSNHEKKLRPIIEKLQSRSRSMAAMYIPKSRFIYHLRNFIIKFLPSKWVASWHANGTKLEIGLTKD